MLLKIFRFAQSGEKFSCENYLRILTRIVHIHVIIYDTFDIDKNSYFYTKVILQMKLINGN